MTYRKVDPRLWDDARFQDLSQPAKLVWLAILTGPHTTTCPGLSRCSVATLSESVGYDTDTVSDSVAEITRAGMAEFDPKARVVRAPNAPKYNPAANPKVLKGWFAEWQRVPESPLKYRHVESLKAGVDISTPSMKDEWDRGFGQVRNPFDTVSIPYPNGTELTSTSTSTNKKRSSHGAKAPATGGESEGEEKTKLPFKPLDALQALAAASGGRFPKPEPRDIGRGTAIALTGHIKRYPTLSEWTLVGEWLAAGALHYRTDLSVGWAASNALADAMAQAREWATKGKQRVAPPAGGGRPNQNDRTPPPAYAKDLAAQSAAKIAADRARVEAERAARGPTSAPQEPPPPVPPESDGVPGNNIDTGKVLSLLGLGGRRVG